MLGKVLDSAIGMLSPKWAFERSKYRRALDVQRSYDASRINRNTYNWNVPTSSADRAMAGHSERTRDRVRDLVRNNAYARGALEAIVANVVGCGIRPVLEQGPVADAYERWCENADVTGRLHFCEMQALALRECIEAGEVLAHYLTRNNRRELNLSPFCLEMMESERLDSNQDTVFIRDPARGFIRRGVSLDGDGKPLGYYLFRMDVFDANYGLTAEFYPANQILHLYRQERVGQTRGISWLAPVVMWLKDLHVYVENELQASAVASCFTVAIKTVDGGATWGDLAGPAGSDGSDTDGNRFENIQPGLVTHLMPNEDVEVINPGRPNSASEPWINLMLRSIAVGTGLSYELVSRDYSRTNFSSCRASSLEDRRRFRPLQKWMVHRFCKPVFHEWFQSCCLAGMEGFPSIDEFLMSPERFTNVEWQAPGWEWVDPLKEANAAKVEVETGFRSRTEIIAERGGDIRKVFAQLDAENELADSLDLNLLEGEPNSKSQSDAQQQEEQDADEERQIASAGE